MCTKQEEANEDEPLRNLPLNALMMASHVSLVSMRAKPTPRLVPCGSRSIRVEMTFPYDENIASRSTSLTYAGRLEM